MPRLIVHGFTISLDGYGASPRDRRYWMEMAALSIFRRR